MCPVEGCSNPSTSGSSECIRHKGAFRFNGLHTFRMAREGGYTQAQLGREMVERSKETGRDKKMAYVGRERVPTEVHRNGRWEKTDAR